MVGPKQDVRRGAAAPDEGGCQTSPHIPLPAGLQDPRRVAGEVFDRIAALYDRARPSYPDESVGELVRRCGLGNSSRVLEIGPGSGQLTGQLAATGASILAVEPGASMAARCRANLAGHPNIEIVVARFEEAAALPHDLDLVVAATSFHWVDAGLAYPKAAALLRPGGFLALITNAHAADGTDNDERFTHEMREVHRRFAPQLGQWTFPTAQEIERQAMFGGSIADVWARVERKLDRVPEVSGLFSPPRIKCYRWLADYDRDGYIAMLASQSSYALMEPERRNALSEEIGRLVDDVLGGRVTKQYVTVLAVARRREADAGRT